MRKSLLSLCMHNRDLVQLAISSKTGLMMYHVSRRREYKTSHQSSPGFGSALWECAGPATSIWRQEFIGAPKQSLSLTVNGLASVHKLKLIGLPGLDSKSAISKPYNRCSWLRLLKLTSLSDECLMMNNTNHNAVVDYSSDAPLKLVSWF